MKNKKFNQDEMTIPLNDYTGEPETSFDLINKYGTYEIQPTADTSHSFPKIAQGLPKAENRKDSKE